MRMYQTKLIGFFKNPKKKDKKQRRFSNLFDFNLTFKLITSFLFLLLVTLADR